MPLVFDHIVLKVNSISQASESYRKAGFTVTPGGVHWGGISENALIFFADGTFIELLYIRKSFSGIVARILQKIRLSNLFKHSPKFGLAHRFYSRAIEAAEGITDFCLLLTDFDRDVQKLDALGFAHSHVIGAGRTKPNGDKIAWKMFSPFADDLPFFRSDYYPKKPIPTEATQHANGITGIAEIHQIVDDYDGTIDFYSKLEIKQIHLDLTNSSIDFGSTVLKLNQKNNASLAKKLKGKGNGTFGLTFSGGEISYNEFHGLVVGSKF